MSEFEYYDALLKSVRDILRAAPHESDVNIRDVSQGVALMSRAILKLEGQIEEPGLEESKKKVLEKYRDELNEARSQLGGAGAAAIAKYL